MDNAQEALLAKELVKAGKLGGKIGGGPAGSIGGWLGGIIASKVLPTETCEQQVIVRQPLQTVLTKMATFLASAGRLAGEDEAAPSDFPSLTGVVGAGFFNMNPAAVQVEVLIATDRACTVRIRAAAKESLIRQHAAEKAVQRVIDYLHTLGAQPLGRCA